MSVKSAFNVMLKKQSREMTIVRPGTIEISKEIRASPSNYSRNLEGPSDMVSKGREFIISREVLDLAGFPFPKRGDRLKDVELGTMAIVEVREAFDLGGEIIGFRVRTG